MGGGGGGKEDRRHTNCIMSLRLLRLSEFGLKTSVLEGLETGFLGSEGTFGDLDEPGVGPAESGDFTLCSSGVLGGGLARLTVSLGGGLLSGSTPFS